MLKQINKIRIGTRLIVAFLVVFAFTVGIVVILTNFVSEMMLVRSAVISLGLLLSMMLFMAISLSKSITEPVSSLQRTVDEIAKGDLTKKFVIESNDEVGELSHSLNKILASVKLAVLKVGLKKQEIGLGEIIKEKEETEKKLKRSEEFLNEVIEHAGVPVLAFDKDDTLLIANEKLLEVTGYNREDIDSEEKWVELAYPTKEVHDKVVKALALIHKGKKVKDFVIPIRCKDESSVIMLSNITAVKDVDGNVIGEVMFMRDLSEIFELEEQLRYWAANDFLQKDGDDSKRTKLADIPGIEVSKSVKKAAKKQEKKTRKKRKD